RCKSLSHRYKQSKATHPKTHSLRACSRTLINKMLASTIQLPQQHPTQHQPQPKQAATNISEHKMFSPEHHHSNAVIVQKPNSMPKPSNTHDASLTGLHMPHPTPTRGQTRPVLPARNHNTSQDHQHHHTDGTDD